MIKPLHCFYNMDSNSVEVTFSDGSVLTIDCEEVENHFAGRWQTSIGCFTTQPWNMPVLLSGEMENYLKGPVLHEMED